MARPSVYVLEGNSYGKLRGTKLYYTGFRSRPKFLPRKGRGFSGLKHLLEQLARRFKKFRLVFVPGAGRISKVGRLVTVRLSQDAVKNLRQRRISENRELNLRLTGRILAEEFPKYFKSDATFVEYRPGMFSEILTDKFDSRLLSTEDLGAVTKFVLSKSSSLGGGLDIPKAYEATKDTQLVYLKRLVALFDNEVTVSHGESWWQDYFSNNILYFHANYIRKIPKMNVAVVTTRFPDFAVATADGYLDILEIKTPDTDLLRADKSRGNYYWSPEVAKAISQVENYIDAVTKLSANIIAKLRDDGIYLRILKPRGLIIAGRTSEFAGIPKRADDFRLLNEGLKNIQVIPYDEVSRHLKNTIESIDRLSVTRARRKRRKKRLKA